MLLLLPLLTWMIRNYNNTISNKEPSRALP